MEDGFKLKEVWSFDHYSNPLLRKLIEDYFDDEADRKMAWEVIGVLNAAYPGAWELLRGELVHSETREA